MFAIGLLTIGAIPTTIGVAEAISAQKKQNAAQKEQAKFHLTAKLSLGGRPPMEAWVVLKDGKLWIDHQESPVEGHKFTGYYFTYPSEEQHKGLVTTISIDPPMLNWIYIHEGEEGGSAMRYGGRKDTLGHLIGPWGWNADETFLTLRGETDCFLAEEDPESGKWFVTLGPPATSASSASASAAAAVPGKKSTTPRAKGRRGGDFSGRHSHRDCRDYDEGDGCLEEEDVEESEEDSGPRRVPVRLRRRMMLGMESKYVKADQE